MMVEGYTVGEWENLISSFGDKPNIVMWPNRYYFDWSNLRVYYFPNSHLLQIKNSLHKFYNSVVREVPIGCHNYDDFNKEKIAQAIKHICFMIGRSANEIELFGLFEYGVNINVGPMKQAEIIKCCVSYGMRMNDFTEFNHRKGKAIGRVSYSHEFKVKIYDKSKQSGIKPSDILRFEVCIDGVGRLKTLLNKPKVTLSDLLEVDNLRVLSDSLLSTYYNVKMIPSPNDGIALTREERLQLFTYADQRLYWWDKTELNQYELNQHRSQGKALLDEVSENPKSTKYIIGKRIKAMLKTLIN